MRSAGNAQCGAPNDCRMRAEAVRERRGAPRPHFGVAERSHAVPDLAGRLLRQGIVERSSPGHGAGVLYSLALVSHHAVQAFSLIVEGGHAQAGDGPSRRALHL